MRCRSNYEVERAVAKHPTSLFIRLPLLQELGYDGDRYMVAGAVIAPEVIIHLTVADMHVDYDSALMVVQSSKAHQYGDLVSRTKLFIKHVSQLCIASNS